MAEVTSSRLLRPRASEPLRLGPVSARPWRQVAPPRSSQSAGSSRLARHRATLIARLSAKRTGEESGRGGFASASSSARLSAMLAERRRTLAFRGSVGSVVLSGRAARGSEELSEEEAKAREELRQRMMRLKRKLRFIVLFTSVAAKYCREHFMTCERLGYQFRRQAEEIDRVTVLGINRADQLFFDRNDYVANKQMRMPAEARRILMKNPALRTEEEVSYAMIALRSVKSISDYPVRMQIKLAQFGMLETYKSSRIVVREGDPAHAYFVILFGTVLVAVLRNADSEAKTVCYLNRGESFGELAIMKRSTRQSTVIAKSEIDLLSISLEIYESIFMVGGRKNIHDPDHNQFIETLYFLQDWPKDLLSEYPDCFIFSYFKRGTVMIKDSASSKWIYIVKSGSVRVLKKLLKVSPKVNKSTGMIRAPQRPRSDLDFFFDRRGLPSPPRCAWSSLGRMDEDEHVIKALNAKVKAQGQDNKAERERKCRFEKQTGATKSRISSAPPTLSGPTMKPGRRTFIDDLEDFDHNSEIETTNKSPEFVHVQTLLKGAEFGLQHIFCDDQPSMCLVSNGAECLLLDKKFYVENCPNRLRDKMRNTVCPYPSPEDLQNKLEVRVNWDAYRQVVLNQVLQGQGRWSAE